MSYFGLADGTSFNSLFGGSVGSSYSGGGSSILADYASIKNGSYYKLMKSYYNGNSKIDPPSSMNSSFHTSTAKDSAKKLASVENSAEDLKKAADELITQGSKSVFRKENVTNEDGTTSYGYNTDAITKKVSAFVKKYNEMIDSADEVSSNSVNRAMENLTKATDANETLLNSVGISVKNDGTLSMDTEAFQKADMGKVKSIFNGTGSYAYQVSARASMVDYNAQREAAKSNTYNKFGSYDYNYNYSYSNFI